MATIISITPAQSEAIRATVDPASEALSLALSNGVRILSPRVTVPWVAEGQHAGMYAFRPAGEQEGIVRARGGNGVPLAGHAR